MNETPQLDDLQLFCQVVRHRSFAATARAMGVSKALVSKRIGLLEQAIKERLFHRTTRHVGLTTQGEVVHQWALRILEDVRLMGEAVSQEKSQADGLIRICSSSGFGRSKLAAALSALALQQPQLEIQLELLDRAVDLVEEGFQLDIRVGSVREGNVITRRIAANRRILCAAPSYVAAHGMPQSVAELARHQCILIRERDQDYGRWTLHGPQGEQVVRVGGRLASNNGEIARQWALDGHGIILRSAWDVADDVQQGRLLHILPAQYQPADVWAVYPERSSASAKVRVCVAFLQQWFATSLAG
ncbi:LysR family transcriptional regulator [Aquitalea sp. ASV11]|uniref:LysR family transcriptional regulator n=1 Tax=Aquitalea sp. ASV11 TaxID=2795103 RepID=UPI0018EAC5C3